MRLQLLRAATKTWCLIAQCLVPVIMASPAKADEPIVLARPEAFRTLVNPNCSHCVDEAKARASELRDQDPVLAWTRGKYDGGAIPIRFFLNPYRVISDTYGVFVFDPDAGFARGYEPSLDFRFYGWRNGIVVMQHKDGTLFSTLSGRAFAGPRKGERLKPVATIATTWGYWNKVYPGSVAYRMFDKYQPIDLPEQDNPDSKSTRGSLDARLPADEEVLGVSFQERQKAYPLASFAKGGDVIHDSLAGDEIAILWYPSTRTAAAYSTRLEGTGPPQRLKLVFDDDDPSAPFLDRESGSRFGVEGRAVSGPLQGKALIWIDSVQCHWFAWAAECPESAVQEAIAARPANVDGGAQTSKTSDKKTEMVLVEPRNVTPAQIEIWRSEGFSAIVVVLDEVHANESYMAASSAAKAAEIDLYYWIEVARNPLLADAHPQWMASLGMHHDWRSRFPAFQPPKQGEVVKAYPWVPIGYAEAFEAHLRRIEKLLAKVPIGYQGLLLNDLQGGPASCGCGNLQCRWAIDYGVPSTATKESSDDAAARFVIRVRDLAPFAQVVPVWMTECEEFDLPKDQASGGRTTGLCGSVACARTTCPKAFANQLTALIGKHTGPLGLFTVQQSCERDDEFYGGRGGWMRASVGYLDRTPVSAQKLGIPHDRLWLVIQGDSTSHDNEATIRKLAADLHAGATIVTRARLDQSYEPRVVELTHRDETR